MHVEERPRPLMQATLLLVLPTVLTCCAAAVVWADLSWGQTLGWPWVARAALSILLAAVPGAVLSSRGQRPGIALFAIALVPALIGIGGPIVRHQRLASPIWLGDMLTREAYAAMRSGWTSVMTGALLSAALCASYCILVGAWPMARSRAAEVWGAGRERMPLLLSGPAAAALCAAAWRLAGVRPLASDLAIWILACAPALLLAGGVRSPRYRRDVLHMLAAFAAGILLLSLAGHARTMIAATSRAPAGIGDAFPVLSNAVLRDTILRWVLAALSAGLGILALLAGRVRLRIRRRVPWGPIAAWLLAAAVPAAGALLPDVRTMQELRGAQGAWDALLSSRAMQLPRCAAPAVPAPVAPGPLVVVPLHGEAQMLGVAGGIPNVAVSGDTPFATVLQALAAIGPAAGSEAEVLIDGCGSQSGAVRRSSLSELRAIPVRTALRIECAGGADPTMIMLDTSSARVLTSGCSPASGPPTRMEIGDAWSSAHGKPVFVGVAADLTVARFLALIADPAAARAVVVLDPGAVRAVLDRAARRHMLVSPGPQGPWKGTLALENIASPEAQMERPEALYGPLRMQRGLAGCFESVRRERHLKLRFEVGGEGKLTATGVDAQDPASACMAEQLRSTLAPDGPPGVYEATLGWYPSPEPAPEGLVSSGMLKIGAEAESGGVRGADALGARLSPSFARCIGEAMQTEPDLSGTAEIKICIQPGGVLEPTGGESNRIPRSALECMRDAVRLVRVEGDYLVAGQAACFRAHVQLSTPSAARSCRLEVSVEEPEREAAAKRDSGESENTWRAAEALRDVLACFGRPPDAPEQQGEIRLALKPNRSGHVMSVTAEVTGAVDARLTRCAADTFSRVVLHVDSESVPPPKLGVTLKVSSAAP